MNPAAVGLLGLESTDVRGRAIESLGVDDELCRDVRRALESGRAQTTERALGDVDRSIIVRSEPTHMQASGPRGLVLMLEDVTHVRRLERMRTEFASNVSHELRTPITSIQGYAELLATDPDGDDRVSHARIIERNAARLSAIIEDLLALARLEESGGGGALENEVLAVHELLGEVTHATAQEAASRDCVLEVQYTEHLEVRGIRPLLEQALGNLVVNAVRYGPESSKVTLSAGLSDQGEVCLSVSDRGPGIAPAHLERIFERFYRVDRGRSREVGGTGLGLAIVKHIAQAHGGRVELASVEGQGSTFTIVLPASGEGAQAGERDLSAVLTHS
jgi:two-component system phosphate regulon sensor histidine kinase PhoR